MFVLRCFGRGSNTRSVVRYVDRRLGSECRRRNRVTVDLKWDGKALTGNITGGDNVTKAIPLTKEHVRSQDRCHSSRSDCSDSARLGSLRRRRKGREKRHVGKLEPRQPQGRFQTHKEVSHSRSAAVTSAGRSIVDMCPQFSIITR